jgi:PAS domain S-box-containing protein
MAARDEERVAYYERQLAAVQQITHIGSWEWEMRTNTVTWSDELYRIYGLEPRSAEITFESFLARVHPDDRFRIRDEVAQAVQRGGRFAYPERIVRPDGGVRELDTVGDAVRNEHGDVVGLIGTCRDVTEERRDERLQAARHRVLEMIASGADLTAILDTLVLAIEEHSPPTIGSVLLLDADGRHVRHASAPHLPEAYVHAIDGFEIGPRAGSCGTAAYLRRPVFVADISADDLWADHRALAERYGLRACWSMPICATDGRVLGTFALYYREPRSPIPSPDEVALIEGATNLAGIAIERRQLEQQLRDLSAHLESVREQERTGIAREIHDELGQALTAMKMDLAWLGRRISGESAVSGTTLLEKIAAMSEMTDEIIRSVRRLSSELRPGALDDLGLLAAIEWQAQEFEKRTHATCTIESNIGDDEQLGRDLSTAVFRIFQEALTNITRHARAGHVEVRLMRADGKLRLEVSDDGKGITDAELRSPKSLGLLGIRERARHFRGSATIRRGQPHGTVVALELPLEHRGAEP